MLAHPLRRALTASAPARGAQASETWERCGAATAEMEAAVQGCSRTTDALAAVLAVASVAGGFGDTKLVLQAGNAAMAAIDAARASV